VHCSENPEGALSWIGKLAPKKKGRKDKAPAQTAVEPVQNGAFGGSDLRSVRRPASRPPLPGFRSTAGDQLDRRLTDRFSNIRMRLRSAFTPSQPVTDRRMFAGRSEVLATLIRSIEDQRQHTVIYGERGIGKTSLLHVLEMAAREARYVVVYISCGAGSNFEEMIRAVAGEIPLLYHTGYGPTASETERGGTFADLIPPGSISALQASDLFARIKGTRVLVVIDEFDRCDSGELRRNMAELMKNLSDRSVRVQLVISGVASDLTELLDHIPSIRRNVYALQIPKMSSAELRELVKIGEDASGITFDEDALELIVTVSQGLPYLSALLSHHAGMNAVEETRLNVTISDVSLAIADALDELKSRISRRSQSHLAQYVSQGSLRQLGALASIAQAGDGRFDLGTLEASKLGSVMTARCETVLASLVADGVLVESEEDEMGQHYHFREDGVAQYMVLLAAKERFFESRERPATEKSTAPAAEPRLNAS
jgi:Cdc6-like AAA superfamily ATPase